MDDTSSLHTRARTQQFSPKERCQYAAPDMPNDTAANPAGPNAAVFKVVWLKEATAMDASAIWSPNTSSTNLQDPHATPSDRKFLIEEKLIRIHFITDEVDRDDAVGRRAPWVVEYPFHGSRGSSSAFNSPASSVLDECFRGRAGGGT